MLSVATNALASEKPALISDIDYRPDTIGPLDSLRTLDIYYPQSSGLSGDIVFYVHGGGWAVGDKANKSVLNKAKLFNALGYVFVSTNYRLSPDPQKGDGPDRIKHPTHINDVADALTFLVRHGPTLGLKVRQIGLIGHSAGAHLVALLATNQTLLHRREIPAALIRGVVILDTLALDVDGMLKGPLPRRSRAIYENAFGTLEENREHALWASASPITFADAADPPVLVITQSQVANRVMQATRFIEALEQPVRTSLFTVPRTHRQINWDVGAVDDPASITPRVVEFFAQIFGEDASEDL